MTNKSIEDIAQESQLMLWQAYCDKKMELESANDEIERLRKVESDLRSCFERVLLDIKFITENDIIPDHILDDVIYQNSFELMTEEFMKEFNNE